MTRKIGFLQLPIYLCFLILIVSCDKPSIPKFQPCDESQTTPGEKSDTLITRIYFDATLSMQGFVVPGSTRYTEICQYLESVITSGWNDGTASFFRFGEEVEKINRDTYLTVGQPEFYEDESIYRETFIEKVINDEAQNVESEEANISPEVPTEDTVVEEALSNSVRISHLTVIVTDLFQDNSDINILVAQLKEKFIKKNLEVGLLGLRSQFDGVVYDTRSEPIPHRSTTDPESYRPFYLLVLGRHADIAHYFDCLIAKGFPEAQTVIFSRYLISPLASFKGASVKWDNLNRKTFIQSQDECLKQFRIVENSDPADISTTLEYIPSPHAMSYDSETLEDSVVAKHAPTGQTEESFDAQECLEVTSQLEKNEDSNKLNVVFDLTPRLLPNKNAVYLFEVTLSPRVDEYIAPDWCSEWDMGRALAGSKTLNLVNFVQDLSQVTAQVHKPKIAKFYFYIQKR